MGYAPVTVTASTTLDRRIHAGTTVLLSAAAGLTITLPAAVGNGDEYDLLVNTTISTNDYIISAVAGGGVMTGVCINAADGGATAVAYETAADTDTITMDGSTTGGIKGDRIMLKDVATNLWRVTILGSASGSEDTPFSAEA